MFLKETSGCFSEKRGKKEVSSAVNCLLLSSTDGPVAWTKD